MVLLITRSGNKRLLQYVRIDNTCIFTGKRTYNLGQCFDNARDSESSIVGPIFFSILSNNNYELMIPVFQKIKLFIRMILLVIDERSFRTLCTYYEISW